MPAKKKEAVAAGLTSFMDQSEIDGFPICEWNTKQFCQLHPDLKIVVEALIADGVTLNSIQDGFIENHLPALTNALIPIMPSLIRISCPDKTDEEYDSLPWPTSIKITMAIIKRNVEHLADFFGNGPQ